MAADLSEGSSLLGGFRDPQRHSHSPGRFTDIAYCVLGEEGRGRGSRSDEWRKRFVCSVQFRLRALWKAVLTRGVRGDFLEEVAG